MNARGVGGKAILAQTALTPQMQEIADLNKESLEFLCRQFLGYKDWDRVHDDVAKFLRKPARKKALLLPRGHLKSSIVTIGYSVQEIIKNPNTRILIANQIWDMSRAFLRSIKGILENSQLKYLHGNFVSTKWNEDLIIVNQRTASHLKEPTVLTTGVEAEQTGGHFDLIILDDLTGLQNCQTPEQREKTKRFRRSMINLLEPGGKLLEIGTRWHLDDTFSDIIEKEAEYYDIMVRRVIENGKIIFPLHFSKRFDPIRKDWTPVPTENCMDYIQHLKKSMPLDEFKAQYENDPISSENAVFKPESLKYFEKRPEGLYVGMGVDLAISQKTEADWTAIAVVGMDKDWNLYVLDTLRGHWSPTDIVNNIFQMQERWKPQAVSMEVNGFQRTLKFAVEEEMRRRKRYFGIEEFKAGPDKTKENRIKALEPFYRRGGVFHHVTMKGKEMETELLTFPKGRHDDIIDAMSQTLTLLSPGMNGMRPDEVRPGTYDWLLREAHRSQHRYRQFFDYGD